MSGAVGATGAGFVPPDPEPDPALPPLPPDEPELPPVPGPVAAGGGLVSLLPGELLAVFDVPPQAATMIVAGIRMLRKMIWDAEMRMNPPQGTGAVWDLILGMDTALQAVAKIENVVPGNIRPGSFVLTQSVSP